MRSKLWSLMQQLHFQPLFSSPTMQTATNTYIYTNTVIRRIKVPRIGDIAIGPSINNFIGANPLAFRLARIREIQVCYLIVCKLPNSSEGIRISKIFRVRRNGACTSFLHGNSDFSHGRNRPHARQAHAIANGNNRWRPRQLVHGPVLPFVFDTLWHNQHQRNMLYPECYWYITRINQRMLHKYSPLWVSMLQSATKKLCRDECNPYNRMPWLSGVRETPTQQRYEYIAGNVKVQYRVQLPWAHVHGAINKPQAEQCWREQRASSELDPETSMEAALPGKLLMALHRPVHPNLLPVVALLSANDVLASLCPAVAAAIPESQVEVFPHRCLALRHSCLIQLDQ